MTKPKDRPRQQWNESLFSTLFVLGFGLATLAFLVAVDRPQWFHIRPISAVAGALYNASDAIDERSADARPPANRSS